MADKQEKPQNVFDFDYSKDGGDRPPQEFYDCLLYTSDAADE